MNNTFENKTDVLRKMLLLYAILFGVIASLFRFIYFKEVDGALWLHYMLPWTGFEEAGITGGISFVLGLLTVALLWVCMALKNEKLKKYALLAVYSVYLIAGILYGITYESSSYLIIFSVAISTLFVLAYLNVISPKILVLGSLGLIALLIILTCLKLPPFYHIIEKKQVNPVNMTQYMFSGKTPQLVTTTTETACFFDDLIRYVSVYLFALMSSVTIVGKKKKKSDIDAETVQQ